MIIKPLIFPIDLKYVYFYHTDMQSQEHTLHTDRERQLYSAGLDSWRLYSDTSGRWRT